MTFPVLMFIRLFYNQNTSDTKTYNPSRAGGGGREGDSIYKRGRDARR